MGEAWWVGCAGLELPQVEHEDGFIRAMGVGDCVERGGGDWVDGHCGLCWGVLMKGW